jgi:hypothetical protein
MLHYGRQQVFGLVDAFVFLLFAASQRFFKAPVPMAKFVSTYRCGAVLDFHQVPF